MAISNYPMFSSLAETMRGGGVKHQLAVATQSRWQPVKWNIQFRFCKLIFDSMPIVFSESFPGNNLMKLNWTIVHWCDGLAFSAADLNVKQREIRGAFSQLKYNENWIKINLWRKIMMIKNEIVRNWFEGYICSWVARPTKWTEQKWLIVWYALFKTTCCHRN